MLPEGFSLHALHSGVKSKQKLDLGLIYSQLPCRCAGVFTRNRFAAAPVLLCRGRITAPIRGVLVNSGHANAFTGAQGSRDAARMADSLEKACDIAAGSALVLSTGRIGSYLPMDLIESGIVRLASLQYEVSSDAFAQAISTTDTLLKQAHCEFQLDGRSVKIYAVAKGAGMIEPNMATMLAFFMTDMPVARPLLQQALQEVVEMTFNTISVDGEQSTNDSVILLSNAAQRISELSDFHDPRYRVFTEHLYTLALQLAKLIVKDGEGATKLIEISVRGAVTKADARTCAYKLANSLLVKTAFFGNQVNWGRFVGAIGSCDILLNAALLDISLGDYLLVRQGESCLVSDDVYDYVRGNDLALVVNLHVGTAECTVYTCDLSYEYVRVNSGYIT